MRIYLNILVVLIVFACNSAVNNSSETDQIASEEEVNDNKVDSSLLTSEIPAVNEDLESANEESASSEYVISETLAGLIEKFPLIEVPFKFENPEFEGVELTEAEFQQLELYEPVYEAIGRIESEDHMILIVNYPIMMSKIYTAVLVDLEGNMLDQLLIYAVYNDETFEFTRSEITESTIYTEFVTAEPDDDYNLIYNDLGKVEFFEFKSGKFDKQDSKDVALAELKLFDIN